MSESGQTRVVAVLDDMFFSSKIKQAANQTAVNLEIFKNAEGLIESLTSEAAKLIIVDLNSKKFDSLALIKDIKARADLNEILIIGYLPHVEEELKKESVLVGCDVVMPRSRFSRELVQILEKYSN